jgi:hypothetical protein
VALIETFTDIFTSADSAKWDYPVTGIAVSAGVMNISTTTAYPTIHSVDTWDLTGSSLTLEVPSMANAGNGTTSTYFGLVQSKLSGADGVLFQKDGGTVNVRHRVATVVTTVNSFAYSSTAHRWVRISETAGTVTWWTSPDRAAWTSQGTWAATIPVTALFVQLGAGYYGTEPDPGVFRIDNVNTVSPVVGAPPQSYVARRRAANF